VGTMSQSELMGHLFRGAARAGPEENAMARRVVAALGVGTADKVLDLGCGAGTVARALARETGCLVTCVDDDDASLEALFEMGRKDGVESLLTPVKGSLSTLSLPEASFSAVVLERPLRYLGIRLEAAGSLCRGLLRPSGRFAAIATAKVGRSVPAAVEAFHENQGQPLRYPFELAQALAQEGYEPLHLEAWTDAVMSAWFRYVEQELGRLCGAELPPAATQLRREVEVFQREGGRACVNDMLVVGRRQEPGEPLPSALGLD